jgi:predicted RNA binding protein YcfA (HicA-like mRNA interferase family)
VPKTKSSPTRTKKTTKASRAVTYGALSHVLEGLGYEKVPARGSHVVFVHPNSKARLFLPWRQPSQNVDPTRLTGVFELVESAGVANRDTVRSALEESSTRRDRSKPAKRRHPSLMNGRVQMGKSRNGLNRGNDSVSRGKSRQSPRDKNP